MLNREDELNLARVGDKESFSLLYDAYVEKIYDYVYYKTLNKEVAEDLASQVFLKVLKKYQ